jgi:hypothetical protein
MNDSTSDRCSFLRGTGTGTPLQKSYAARTEGTRSRPVVGTTYGKVAGAFNGKVNTFKGIPVLR